MNTPKNKRAFVKSITIIALFSIVLFACKKEKSTINQPQSPPADPPAPAVLLKEIVIPNLPSPYYHFEYDVTGKADFVSFASDFTRYDIVYDDAGKIMELRNDIFVNRDTLRYFYDNTGKVVAINYIDINGRIYIKIALTYDGKKLKTLERKRIFGSDFVVNKTMSFSYYNDGNLKEIVDHRPAVNVQTESTNITRFEDYDNNINVDAFGLLHNDFFDHLVFLPGIRLQINNPRREILTGFNSYTVDYTYTYDEKHQPISKKGDLIFTAGPSAGQRFQTNSSYTYY